MKLEELRIHNYKSLRNVVFKPAPFSCVVGPNAAGKSNFADGLHFLSEIYTYGLEVAIARKGGYENIAYRHARRSKAAMKVDLTITANVDEIRLSYLVSDQEEGSEGQDEDYELQFRHSFSFNAIGETIKADFEVNEESLTISYRRKGSSKYRLLYRIELRLPEEGGQRRLIITPTKQPPRDVTLTQDLRAIEYMNEYFAETEGAGFGPSPQSLSFSELPIPLTVLGDFTRYVARFQIYRLTPEMSRASGVPTPNPTLGLYGENLPALVDWLRSKRPDRWSAVMAGMQDVMPTLTDIHTQYLHTKTLGLVFEETGVGRGWHAHEVSDGTIQLLAILVASADPRASVLFIEEPENSIHPWVIRTTVDRLRELSSEKSVILTTHSPIIVDMFSPSEVWVASRAQGQTHIEQLVGLSKSLEKNWLAGKFKVSDYLDSGLLPQAVPGD